MTQSFFKLKQLIRMNHETHSLQRHKDLKEMYQCIGSDILNHNVSLPKGRGYFSLEFFQHEMFHILNRYFHSLNKFFHYGNVFIFGVTLHIKACLYFSFVIQYHCQCIILPSYKHYFTFKLVSSLVNPLNIEMNIYENMKLGMLKAIKINFSYNMNNFTDYMIIL